MPAARPSFTLLLDWMEGRLEPARAAEVAAQVAASDSAVREELEWIRSFLLAATAMPLEAPPPEVSQRLRDAFVGLHQPSAVRGWTEASVLYDSRDTLGAVGVRSVDDGINLAFESDLGRFVLAVRQVGPAEIDVEGMIRDGGAGAGIDVALLEHGQLRRAVRVDRDGRFDLTGVPAGVDELWLTSGASRARARLDLIDR